MLKEQGDNKTVMVPSYTALQLDSLESLLSKWAQSIGGRSTEQVKAYAGQYRDWIAAQPSLFADLARQKNPELNERHTQLITRANALLSLTHLTLARKGEAGHLMGAAFAE